MESKRLVATRVDADSLATSLLADYDHEGQSVGYGDDNHVCEKLSVDDILTKWVGEFGWAQLAHFVLVSIAWTVEGLHTLVMIFADRAPAWQCRPTLSSSMNSTAAVAGFSNGVMDMSCTPSSSLCSMDPRAWEWVGGRGVSTVSEWGLICGDEYKVGLAQSAFFIGGLFGAGIFGHLSDSFLGRKGALFLACAVAGLAGIATSVAPSYGVYVALRGLTGLSCGGVGLSSFVLATEPVGPSKRGRVGMSAFYFFSFGIMTLPAFAYYTSSWRLLYAATSAPALLYCALVLPFVWESPRWCLVRGRGDEAMRVLCAFAKQNGRVVPAGVGLATEDGTEPESDGGASAGHVVPPEDARARKKGSLGAPPKAASGTLVDVLRNPATRSRMLIMVVIWFTCAAVYYGISLNVVNLGTNLYLGVFLNALVEMPAFALTAWLLEKFGRRSMLASTMLLSGLCCLAGSVLFVGPATPDLSGSQHTNLSSDFALQRLGFSSPLTTFALAGQTLPSAPAVGAAAGVYKVLRVLCSAVGIFGMAGTYNLIYIYTTELFPTVVRNAALGLTSQTAGIGSIIAPAVVVLGRYHSSLPFAIFGVMAMAGGLLALGLPETLHQPLFETLEGLERSEKSRE